MGEDRTDSMTFVNTLAAVEDAVARETLAKEVVSKNLTREQLKQRLALKVTLPPAKTKGRTCHMVA